MEDMAKVTAVYYDELMAMDPLLPQDDESMDERVMRIQEEHKFYAVNNGYTHCWCIMCWQFGFFFY